MTSARTCVAAALATLALTLTAGCASDGAASAPTMIAVTDQTKVIDVRTSSEYASGHLRDSVNLDVNSPGFTSSVAALDKSGEYVVYCRSGNRSAAAVQQMKDLGFTNVVDAGGLQEAQQQTGLPVVQ